MARTKRATRADGRKRSSFTYDGKRYYVYGFSEKELRDKERAKLEELKSGIRDRKDPTLKAYYEIFTDNRRDSVKASTLATEICWFNACASVKVNRNGKTLGQCRLSEITPADIRKVQKDIRDSGKSTTATNSHIKHLKHIFKTAVDYDYIAKNPCRLAENLKKTEEPAEETIHRALSEQETKKLFSYAKEHDSYYYNAFYVMIHTGMRVGEIGALMPIDIDRKEKIIHVRRTIARESIGYVIGDSAKTDAGERDIPVTDDVLEVIRNQQRMNRLLFGDDSHIKVIFPTTEGKLLTPQTPNRELRRICKAIGIDRITCHAFRATFATRFIEQRPQDYKLLSEILGHGNINITLDLYTHVMKENKVKAMNELKIVI